VVNGESNAIALHLVNAGTNNYTLLSASSSFHNPANNWALVNQFATKEDLTLTDSVFR